MAVANASLGSFSPALVEPSSRARAASVGWRFVRKPRHVGSRQFESQPTNTRGRYEHTLNARPDPPSGRSGMGAIVESPFITGLEAAFRWCPRAALPDCVWRLGLPRVVPKAIESELRSGH